MLLTTLDEPGKVAWLVIIAAACTAVLVACRRGTQSMPAPLAQSFQSFLEELRQARNKAKPEEHTAEPRQRSMTMGFSSKDMSEPVASPG